MKSIKKMALVLAIVMAMVSVQSIAFAAGTEEEPTAHTQAALGRVTNFKAVAKSTTTISLTWTKAAGVTKYILYRSTSRSGNYSNIGTLRSTITSFSDMGLSAGRTYYYKLVPYQNATKGVTSSIVSAKTKSAAPQKQKPSFTVFVPSETKQDTFRLGLILTNYGTKDIIVRPTNAWLEDDDYASFNRNLTLTNFYEQPISSQVIKPGEAQAEYIHFYVSYPAWPTWYDRYSTIYFDFDYDGARYQCEASSYYGSYYSAY